MMITEYSTTCIQNTNDDDRIFDDLRAKCKKITDLSLGWLVCSRLLHPLKRSRTACVPSVPLDRPNGGVLVLLELLVGRGARTLSMLSSAVFMARESGDTMTSSASAPSSGFAALRAAHCSAPSSVSLASWCACDHE